MRPSLINKSHRAAANGHIHFRVHSDLFDRQIKKKTAETKSNSVYWLNIIATIQSLVRLNTQTYSPLGWAAYEEMRISHHYPTRANARINKFENQKNDTEFSRRFWMDFCFEVRHGGAHARLSLHAPRDTPYLRLFFTLYGARFSVFNSRFFIHHWSHRGGVVSTHLEYWISFAGEIVDHGWSGWCVCVCVRRV